MHTLVNKSLFYFLFLLGNGNTNKIIITNNKSSYIHWYVYGMPRRCQCFICTENYVSIIVIILQVKKLSLRQRNNSLKWKMEGQTIDSFLGLLPHVPSLTSRKTTPISMFKNQNQYWKQWLAYRQLSLLVCRCPLQASCAHMWGFSEWLDLGCVNMGWRMCNNWITDWISIVLVVAGWIYSR